MILKILYLSFLFFILIFFAPKTADPQSELRIEKQDNMVIYEITEEKKDQNRIDTERSWEVLKELRIIIDRRGDDGKGQTYNR